MITVYFITAIGLISLANFLIKGRLMAIAVSLLSNLFTWLYAIYAWKHIDELDSYYFQFDSIGVLLTFILAIISTASIYQSFLYIDRHHHTSRQNAALFFSLFSSLIGVLAIIYFVQHIGLMWALIELTTVLVGMLIYQNRDRISLEASWKYLFIGSVGITLAFAGILFLSLAAEEVGVRDLTFNTLRAHASDMQTVWLQISFALIVTGFSCKFGAFPLQMVSIDAHHVAPPSVNAVMGTALKNMGILTVIRMIIVVGESSIADWAGHVLILMGVLSIATSALELSRVKILPRMLGYSSTEHIGIILIALGVGGIGYYAAILHMIFHSFVKAGFFLHLGQMFNYYVSDRISRVSDYYSAYPFGGMIMILALLSASALPPSGIFISEIYVLKAIFNGGYFFLGILTIGLMMVIIYYMWSYSLSVLFKVDRLHQPLRDIKNNYLESVPHISMLLLAVILGFWMPIELMNLIDGALKLFA